MFVSAVIFCSLKVLFLPTFALTNMLPLFNYGLHINRTYAINTPSFFQPLKPPSWNLQWQNTKGQLRHQHSETSPSTGLPIPPFTPVCPEQGESWVDGWMETWEIYLNTFSQLIRWGKRGRNIRAKTTGQLFGTQNYHSSTKMSLFYPQ